MTSRDQTALLRPPPTLIHLGCGGQLLNVTFSFLSAMCIRWPGFVLIRVSCCCVIDEMSLGYVCCARLIRSLIIVCSASIHLLLLEFDISELRPPVIHWSLEYQGVELHNLHGLSCRSNAEWPSLHCVWYRNAEWVQRCSQLLVANLSRVFLSFPWRWCLWGCESNL